MTDTGTTKRAVTRGGLFVNDAELIERLGLPYWPDRAEVGSPVIEIDTGNRQ